MNVINIYRFLRNFVVIKVYGGFPERFINLCNRENIQLWDTSYRDNGIITSLSCKSFFMLNDIRKKSGVKIKILKKEGLTFLCRRKKERKFLLCGIIFSLLSMFIMNSFVWCVEIKGAETLSDDYIFDYINSYGLRYGTFRPAFDESEVSRKAVNGSDGKILWMAINIKGSKAVVEVKERTVEKDDEFYDVSNIIADFDGIILSARTMNGVSVAKAGNAVKKGDILVSGISENSDGSVSYHASEAVITAVHKKTSDENYPLTQKYQKIDYLHKGCYLNLLSLKIPLFIADKRNFDKVYTYRNFLMLNEDNVPLGYVSRADIKYSDAVETKGNLLYFLDDFTEKEYMKFRNTNITGSSYTLSVSENYLNISAEYDCIDFIGKNVPIKKEN